MLVDIYLCGLAVLAAGCVLQSPLKAESLMVRARPKPDKEWKEYPTRTLEQLTGFAPAKVLYDRFGGWKNEALKQNASGYFQTKKIDGRWWLIDPEGYPFLHVGVVSVRLGTTEAQRTRATQKFGTPEKWAQATAQQLWQNGFNGTGAWSNDETLRGVTDDGRRLVYTPIWNFMSSYGKKRGGTTRDAGHTGYPQNTLFVFDPEFAAFCDEHAKKLAATKDDPFLLGHFSDNEMPMPLDALDRYLSLPATDPGHIAAQRWLDERKGKPSTKADIGEADRGPFRKLVVSKYFEIVSRAIKKYDPNHLYLGSRMYGGELKSQGVFEAAGTYLDAISINYYGAWTPDPERMANWEKWSGKPFMITEWYVKGDDVGLANKSGAGWIVPTQNERGLFYQNFALGLLESKNCVGWHWFRYMDNDPDDTTTDPSNRDANKGIVTIHYDEYAPLLLRMKTMNEQVYTLSKYFDATSKP